MKNIHRTFYVDTCIPYAKNLRASKMPYVFRSMVQYLREVAVQELIYYDLDNPQSPTD